MVCEGESEPLVSWNDTHRHTQARIERREKHVHHEQNDHFAFIAMEMRVVLIIVAIHHTHTKLCEKASETVTDLRLTDSCRVRDVFALPTYDFQLLLCSAGQAKELHNNNNNNDRKKRVEKSDLELDIEFMKRSTRRRCHALKASDELKQSQKNTRVQAKVNNEVTN